MDILTTKYQTEKHLLMASDAPQPLMHLLYRMTPVEFANLRKILGLSSRGGRPRVSVTIDQADDLKDLFRSLASRLTELPVSTLFLLVAEGSVHSTRTLWQVLRVELMQLVESGRCLTPGGLNAGG